MKKPPRLQSAILAVFPYRPFVNFYLDRASSGQVRCKVIRATLDYLCLYGGDYERSDACQVSNQWL